RYERSVYCPNNRNWPDFRSMEEGEIPGFPSQWCHGATGIGLARLGMLDHFEDDQILEEIQIACEKTVQIPFREMRRDSVCCGHAGNLDLFLVGAKKLQQPELTRIARSRAGTFLAAAKKNGIYQTLLPGFKEPSFFQGLSGIGYQLLRIHSPDRIPSVLLWE
ncbi:MAG: lanthionine synthetase LanC family protein, partial [Planctomycetota bacterium]|nr:lanthionine synthetase LanC family protein [Planctomycetota bacterium]